MGDELKAFLVLEQRARRGRRSKLDPQRRKVADVAILKISRGVRVMG